jgi:hypothetical protein
MRRIRSHLTYANVMATLAVFLVLGGGAYAAFHLPKNSVKSRNIVNGQVKTKDLGVPVRFKDAGLPGLCKPGVWVNNNPTTTNRAAYARDAFGFVHLRGIVSTCNGAGMTIFKLPAGFRPAKLELLAGFGFSSASAVQVAPGGRVKSYDPDLQSLDGITFRCGPSGHHGCP